MTVKTGFFKVLTGVCAGREVFRTLRFQSWGRIIWHLFFLSLVTGVITGNVQVSRLQPGLEAMMNVFTGLFGEKVYVNGQNNTWNWVAPVKDPGKSREMAIPGGGRFYYTGVSREIPSTLKNVTGPIVIWTPAHFFFIQNQGTVCHVLKIRSGSGAVEALEFSRSRVEKIFSDNSGKLPFGLAKMPAEEIGEIFKGVSAVLTFFFSAGTVLRNFLLVWLYTGIFMAMYRLLNGPSGRLRSITLGQMWKCGIYAAFPPMIVASFFPILELPFLSYETVFMIGLLIFWMAVTAKLERTPDDRKE